MKLSALLIAIACAAASGAASAQAGKAVYEKTCALCHGPGLAGAPKFGDAAQWGPRVRAGMPTLYKSALQGTPNGMPAKGANLSLSDADVKAAVDYMVAASGGAPKTAAAPAPAPAPVPKKPAAAPVPAAEAPSVAAPGPKTAAVAAPPAPVAAAATTVQVQPHPVVATVGDPNAFNRLLTPPSARNPPPHLDGIHDPANPGTMALQPPLASFGALPKANAGNRIDWVAALSGKQVQPRWDRNDPAAAAVVMDLNIVREVKGSMPDVVYPHKQHTEWLDCSNCHPAIFVPQKGANQISMAAIMLGEKCGVCHGKVAFPVSECRLCHSKKKDVAAQSADTLKKDAPVASTQEAKK